MMARAPSLLRAATFMPGSETEIFDPKDPATAFSKLTKPAQRALIGASVTTPRDLSRRTRAEVAALRGIGRSAFPVLEQALKEAALDFQ